MTGLLKTAALAAAVCTTSLVCLQAANAGEFNTIYPSYGLYRLPNGSLAVNPAVRAEAYGITAPAYNYGLNAPSRTYGITAPSHVYGITAPVAAGLQPWSPQWFNYCQNRYRTFEPRSGTFTGYDGGQHFCLGS